MKILPFLLLAPVSAFAQDAAPNPDGDVFGFLKLIHDAVTQKDWGKLLFFVVTLLVWASRKFFAKKFPALASGVATIAYTFALSFAGMLATSWPIGGKPSASSVFVALNTAFAAAGGWSVLKSLLEAAAKKYDWAAWLLGKMIVTVPAKPELKAVENPPAE